LNARDPLSDTGAAADEVDPAEEEPAAGELEGGVLAEPPGLFEQAAADRARRATAGIAASALAVVLMCFVALRVMGEINGSTTASGRMGRIAGGPLGVTDGLLRVANGRYRP
jgi:hypothetical protein